MLAIDKYAYTNRIADWSPQIKALLWLVGMFLSFQPMLWLKGIVLIAVVWLTIYLTKVTLHRYLKWFYAVFPLLILSVIGIVFTVTTNRSEVLWGFNWFGMYFGFSRTMLPVALKMALQAFTAIACTYWFALTTPFQQIIMLLTRLHLPRLLIEETLLIYRFIFIFMDAFLQIYQAQKLRFGYQNFRVSIHSSGILVKMLFELVIINYGHMQHALEAKLYDGEFYVGGK